MYIYKCKIIVTVYRKNTNTHNNTIKHCNNTFTFRGNVNRLTINSLLLFNNCINLIILGMCV